MPPINQWQQLWTTCIPQGLWYHYVSPCEPSVSQKPNFNHVSLASACVCALTKTPEHGCYFQANGKSGSIRELPRLIDFMRQFWKTITGQKGSRLNIQTPQALTKTTVAKLYLQRGITLKEVSHIQENASSGMMPLMIYEHILQGGRQCWPSVKSPYLRFKTTSCFPLALR